MVKVTRVTGSAVLEHVAAGENHKPLPGPAASRPEDPQVAFYAAELIKESPMLLVHRRGTDPSNGERSELMTLVVLGGGQALLEISQPYH
jgi:hypothetical protein